MYLLEQKEATDGCIMITASGIKNTERERREGRDQSLRSHSSLFSGIPAERRSSAQPN